ncbi:NUDIX hydrolase [Chelatococcus reniformis]|uniref:DNA mismatch repair protein MutT n=1 Tax=Chelatococcus reniformis TaxID=1494448 RepID=A0A916U5Z0_9HYPH|nr:NUDIX domain-containing protein [Chelatococcus reniformis]GGC61121.1 DNA mismatch repair protein MutT [Chelatococcus reniformis]
MTVWTPAADIRVKVIGLAWNGPRLLAAEVATSDGTIKGVRPLGGSIHFGETREQALHREFAEELGCPIAIGSPWRVFENIYEHEGAIGHEIVFAADVELMDRSLYDLDRIAFAEDDGLACVARWFSLDALASAGLALYPDGLRDALGG